MQVRRFDVGELRKPERTPQGGLRAAAYLTRTGVLIYHDEEGNEIREYRPPSEVFAPESMATMRGAPLTLLHPDEFVTPKNFREHAVGYVSEEIKKDGGKLAATVTIQDEEAITAVERDKIRQVSAGYTAHLEMVPGITPEGERYDRIQRNIRYNHAALVPHGRAGAEVALRLDSANNATWQASGHKRKATPMEYELIKGVKYEVGSDAHRAAIARRDEEQQRLDSEAQGLRSQKDTLAAQNEVLKKQHEELTAKVKELESPTRIDAAIKARLSLAERAKKIAGDKAKLEGTDREIMVGALAVAYPDMKLDAQSDDYVRSAFDFAALHAQKTDALESLGQVRESVAGSTHSEPKDPVKEARSRMMERNREAWKTGPTQPAAK